MRWMILLFCFLICAGCQFQKPLMLYSLHDHVYFVPKGVQVQTVNFGVITTKYPSILVSEFYFNELFEVKIEEVEK